MQNRSVAKIPVVLHQFSPSTSFTTGIVKSLCTDLILLTLAGKFPLSEKLKFSEIEDSKLAGS